MRQTNFVDSALHTLNKLVLADGPLTSDKRVGGDNGWWYPSQDLLDKRIGHRLAEVGLILKPSKAKRRATGIRVKWKIIHVTSGQCRRFVVDVPLPMPETISGWPSNGVFGLVKQTRRWALQLAADVFAVDSDEDDIEPHEAEKPVEGEAVPPTEFLAGIHDQLEEELASVPSLGEPAVVPPDSEWKEAVASVENSPVAAHRSGPRGCWVTKAADLYELGRDAKTHPRVVGDSPRWEELDDKTLKSAREWLLDADDARATAVTAEMASRRGTGPDGEMSWVDLAAANHEFECDDLDNYLGHVEPFKWGDVPRRLLEAAYAWLSDDGREEEAVGKRHTRLTRRAKLVAELKRREEQDANQPSWDSLKTQWSAYLKATQPEDKRHIGPWPADDRRTKRKIGGFVCQVLGCKAKPKAPTAEQVATVAKAFDQYIAEAGR